MALAALSAVAVFDVAPATAAPRVRRFAGTYFGADPDGAWDRELRASYETAGTLALDAAGNIVGTQDAGQSFSWLRR